MVKFRFSIALLCIIMPPILYVASVHFLEGYAENHIRAKLETTYLGNTQQLLTGSESLREAIRKNLERYLSQSRWLKWGGQATVTVQTRLNTLLYPLIYTDTDLEPERTLMPIEIATENFRLINEGLELFLTFKLPHNTTITNLLLITLISISMLTLLLYYKYWSVRYHHQTAQQSAQLERLSQLESQQRQQMQTLQKERTRMADDIQKMRARLDKQKAASVINEEEMLEELISLEEKIARKEKLHAQQNLQIDALQAKLEQFEEQLQKENRRKQRPLNQSRKRLTTLYKNLDIHDRAVEGYTALTDDLKLKCEEVIVQLNESPSSVQIKRKVFGKKNRTTVLEVAFGYKGRLYFLPKGDKRAELLTIGTKNSQQQDLAYLERL
ncbi:MAG: hypothetical protein PVH87_10370 [Desulfobacteraceae bacterium]|jgi:DNA repair exonuclease SbcCD ATPase subunit